MSELKPICGSLSLPERNGMLNLRAAIGEGEMNRNLVLLVEDDVDEASLAARSFAKNKRGNDLILARDGAEALDCVFGMGRLSGKDLIPRLQVVLLDLNLPKIGGLEVLRRLRTDERTKRIPVVILTSSDEELDRIEAYRLGANTYIRKPVDYPKFVDAIHSLGVLLVNPR